MDPTLEFFGKSVMAFDVCAISFVLGIIATVLLVGRVQTWLKLPSNHWAIGPLTFAGAWITLQVGLSLAKLIWTWDWPPPP